MTAASAFSVVIVNYNGGTALAEALASCVTQGVDEGRCIVVDNGSRDASLERVAQTHPRTEVIRNGCNGGFARAVNQGLRRATGDYVLILNNDARLLPETLPAFAACFAAHPALVLAGARLLSPDGSPQNCVAALPRWWHEFFPPGLLKRLWPQRFAGKMAHVTRAQPVPSVIGAALVLRRGALPQLGFLDEDFFFYLEETEWCRRAWEKGLEVWFCPAAPVIHQLGQTANRFRVAARIEFQRSKLLYLRKTEGLLAAGIVALWLPVKAAVDTLSNGLAMLASLGLSARLRRRSRGYATILLWHLLLRPRTWGLPDKCPQRTRP